MDAPCNHFFSLNGDEVTCANCGRYPLDETIIVKGKILNRNEYVQRENKKPHKEWYSYLGTAEGRGNRCRGKHSRIHSLLDKILFSLTNTALKERYGVSERTAYEEKRRRRNGRKTV